MDNQFDQLDVTERTEPRDLKYTGSDRLLEGYAVCLDRDAGTAADEDYTRNNVEKPATGNLLNLAGIVAQSMSKAEARKVQIIEPVPGRLVRLYTDQDCDLGETLLTVKPGSYIFGGAGEGMICARAQQTVDRSSTNGLVLAEWLGIHPSYRRMNMGTPSATSNKLSAAIWETCPWVEMQADPGLGFTFWDDFVKPELFADGTPKGGYMTDQDTDVTIQSLETYDEVGGVLEIANNDADNDFGHIWVGDSATTALMVIAATSHKPFWFEARFKKAGIGNDGLAFFVGLGEVGLMSTDGGALADDTGEVKDENFIGFQCLNADGDAMLPVFKADGQTKANGTSVALVADKYINVGLHGDGTVINAYVNNVVKHAITAALIAGATFPSAQYLTPMVLTKTGSAAEVAFQMDWWRFAQLR